VSLVGDRYDSCMPVQHAWRSTREDYYIFGVVLILSGRERESRFCSESRVSACALSLASVTYLVSTSLFLSCVSTFGHVYVSIPYLLEFIHLLYVFVSLKGGTA